ncbi:MAG: sigma-70 family RNA polymerase sigma factor [Candidatus Omnitrophica bacterium]|nr:sigma-70 family RNA polymerase sigma factor [Candidatus Omnitrophota bacterium]
MNNPAETELIDRCRRGEAAAWDQLFDLHYAATARFVFQLAPDFKREDVEEICQDAFMAVIKRLESFRGQSQFQTWLFCIAANKARDYRERQNAAKRGGGAVTLSLHATDPEMGPAIDPPGSDPGPDTQLIKAERLAMVGHALQQLELPCREMIELRYFGDLSYEEIGLTLRLNPKTVSSRLSRCLDRLAAVARGLLARENSTPYSV